MNDFNKFDFNLNILLDKLSKENKQVYLLSDFNNWWFVKLRSVSTYSWIFILDSLASNSFIPCILQPTRLTSHSITLIDNVFSNIISREVVSGKCSCCYYWSFTSGFICSYWFIKRIYKRNFRKRIFRQKGGTRSLRYNASLYGTTFQEITKIKSLIFQYQNLKL